MKVDLNKLIDCNIEIVGKCNTMCRQEAVEYAIGLVQQGSDYMETQYIGVKNYAHFGDQREDHGYGMCPRHGSIVFEIKKKDRNKPHANNDIYYLIVARDNPSVSIGELLKEKRRIDAEIEKINSLIASLDVEAEKQIKEATYEKLEAINKKTEEIKKDR